MQAKNFGRIGCARPPPHPPVRICHRVSRRLVVVDSTSAAASAPRVRPVLAKPSQEQIVLLITIALLIGFGLTISRFATLSNLLNLLRSISILGILGLGMGLIVISRGIDLSEVAIMAGSWAIALIEIQNGMPVGWACLVALGLALMIGVVNG